MQNAVLLFFKKIYIKINIFSLQLNLKRNFSICQCFKETKNLLIAQLHHQKGFVRAVLENHNCDVKKYKRSDKTLLRTELCKKEPSAHRNRTMVLCMKEIGHGLLPPPDIPQLLQPPMAMNCRRCWARKSSYTPALETSSQKGMLTYTVAQCPQTTVILGRLFCIQITHKPQMLFGTQGTWHTQSFGSALGHTISK